MVLKFINNNVARGMRSPMKQPQKAGNQGKKYIFPKNRPANAPSFAAAIGRAGVIGLHPLSGLLVGGLAGYFLRERFEAPWLFWVLLLAGFIAGCRNAYRDAKALVREQDRENGPRDHLG